MAKYIKQETVVNLALAWKSLWEHWQPLRHPSPEATEVIEAVNALSRFAKTLNIYNNGLFWGAQCAFSTTSKRMRLSTCLRLAKKYGKYES